MPGVYNPLDVFAADVAVTTQPGQAVNAAVEEFQAGLIPSGLYGKKPPQKKPAPAPLKIEDQDRITISQLYGVCGGAPDLANATRFMGGLECEIEAIPKNKYAGYSIFAIKEDGSLRNGGAEYVSIPERRDLLAAEFKALQDWLKLDYSKDPFSHRTSVHVHVNVASLTARQAKNMLLLYALFEEFFFSMVKPERRANIHCVPLTETHLPSLYHKDISFIAARWSKYSALNLCRLADLGTFEFRHHHGTGDVGAIETWLKVLDNLWTLSRQIVIDSATLSDPYRIHAWFSTIFQPSERTMMLSNQVMNIIGNSLIDVKFSTIKE